MNESGNANVNPKSNSFVLDSFALLAYLGGEPGMPRIKELLGQSENGKCRLFLCMINFGEVLYLAERRRGFAVAQSVQALIENLPIEIIEASRNLILDAAHIKAQYTLSYADAFVVATAVRETAIILTGDPEFESVETMAGVEWLKK